MIKLREFENKDLDGCVRLLQAGHDPDFTAQRFSWLHLENPLAPSRIALAEEDGRLIGCYGVIKKRLLFSGVEYVGGRDIDPVVHPDYRGKGVFTRLLDYGLENFREVDLFFNFANAASAPGFLKKGWRLAGHLDDRVFQASVGTDPKQLLLYCLSWGLMTLTGARVSKDCLIEELGPESVINYSNVLNVFSDSKISVERGWQYLQWRYLDKPGQGYRFLLESLAGVPQKLYILSKDCGNSEVTLFDVMSAAGAKSSLRPCFEYLRRHGNQCKIKVWHRFPETMSREFVRKPFNGGHGCSFLVRGGNGKSLPSTVYDCANWTITHGDLEVL